jgi:hypothetical protein
LLSAVKSLLRMYPTVFVKCLGVSSDSGSVWFMTKLTFLLFSYLSANIRYAAPEASSIKCSERLWRGKVNRKSTNYHI